MAAPQVNGDTPHRQQSQTLTHFTSYPLVNDALTQFRSMPAGQKSIELGDAVYKRWGAPLLAYLERPYQYVSPYVAKVDQLGDRCLVVLDEKVPAVKKPTGELYSDAQSLVYLPFRLGQNGKDHVIQTYSEEHKKVGGANSASYIKAVVATGLVLSTEALNTVLTFLNTKKNEAKATAQNAQNKANQ